MMSKRGQVMIFVILAIAIIGVIVLFFVFKGSLFGERIPAQFVPVYNYYQQCIQEETLNGINLLESQGGRISVGDILPGNDFNPFSSHLQFLGFSIPYWYGVSGNNLALENVPTLSSMEDELSAFLEERINDCDFSQFATQGFFVEVSEPDVRVQIEDNNVRVTADAPLVTYLAEESARRTTHEVTVNSRLGGLYEAATAIYTTEQESVFLENYALDVLQSYAPVDSVEVQCSPKIWKTPEVVREIKQGLGANIGAIHFAGAFARKGDSSDRYFAVDTPVDEPVTLQYLPDAFPSKIEITPASQALMVAEPVGTQEGLGVMGFCYVPYHFVYDVSFPVLVQIGDGFENFQFPMVVTLDNNLPRESTATDLIEEDEIDVCAFAEGSAVIKTYDRELNPLSTNITYNCFDSFCELGETIVGDNGAGLEAAIPVCVNGKLIARAEGYADKSILFSSNSENFAELILDREYPVTVEVRLGGKVVQNTTAVVHFAGQEGKSVSAVLPESSTVALKEGLYDISAYVYGNSNVIIPATRKTECFTVARDGIAGLFGSTREECVDVEIPAVTIDYALRGGGKTTSYILESELGQGTLVIDVSELPRPTSLEQLQYNYEVFDTLGVQLSFT